MSKKVSVKKAQYYVWYLGWKECNGIWGREFTEPIVKQLADVRRSEILPKLTIEVSKKDLKIVQLVEKKKGKIEKLKYPSVASKDITYAVQALSPDDDVVACIYLGFNPQTGSAVHVHVYRCDSPETAEILEEHLNQIIDIPEHKQRVEKIERELVAKGQITPRSSHNYVKGYMDDSSTRAPSTDDGVTIESRSEYNEYQQHHHSQPNGRMEYQEQRQNYNQPTHHDTQYDYGRNQSYADHVEETGYVYDSLAAELKERLGNKKKTPLLLPPKDYDTTRRMHGNLSKVQERKSLNAGLVGPMGAGPGDLKTSIGDSARGDSEGGSQRNSNSDEVNVFDDRRSNHSSHSSRNSREREERYANGHHDNHPTNGYSDKRSSGHQEEDEELVAVTPRWKSGQQQYVPPSSPRAMSPAVPSDPYSGSRSVFTVQDSSRPLSPGPELRQANYFPPDRSLPGYLPQSQQGGRENYPKQGPAQPNYIYHPTTLAHPGANPSSKKYTASTLGLVEPSRGRTADEGYRSLERGMDSVNLDPGVSRGGGYRGRGYDLTQSMPAVDLQYALGDRTNSRKQKRGKTKDDVPPPDYSLRGPPAAMVARSASFKNY